ncbi:GGDEF domain-containing protein [Kineococcus sp. SYSU DK003]|uniref:GGDEF domain-containing protein n=1 Tax=Kineococcus sp. SYSU DK003 TaxID=3383124 RepID=UPI003D7EDE71
MTRADPVGRTSFRRRAVPVAAAAVLVAIWLWVLRDYRATIDLDIVLLEAVAAVVAVGAACLAPGRHARRALLLLSAWVLLTLLGDSYWLFTVDPTGLSYLEDEFEPGFTVTVELVRYVFLVALIAHTLHRAGPSRSVGARSCWPPARAGVARMQLTAATAAVALVLTPLGGVVDDGKSYSLFCFFDIVTVAIALGAVASLTNGARSREPVNGHGVRQVVATSVGVCGLVLGDAGMVVSQTRDWVVGGAVGLAAAVTGAGVLVLTHLREPRFEPVTVAVVPAPPARTPAVAVVVTTVLVQNILPMIIAAATWGLVHDALPGPGPATLGATATAILLSIAHAGIRARDSWRDRHRAEAAVRDDLTGVYSRRGLADFARQHLISDLDRPDGVPRQRQQVGAGLPVDQVPGWSVVLLDLDGFKAVNDELGHDAGDDVLRAVAARLAGVVDGHGLVARLGGDEFVLLLHDQPPGEVIDRQLLRRVPVAVEEPVATARGETASVGCSCGAAVVDLSVQDPLPAALKVADERMYQNKRRRRRTTVTVPGRLGLARAGEDHRGG